MQLAHAIEHSLAGLVIDLYLESWVFFGQGAQGVAHLVLVHVALRLNRQLDNRLGEVNRLQDDGGFGVGQCVTSEGVLLAQRRGDIARADFLQVFAVVGMHPQDAADTLALVFSAVQHGVADAHHARIDAEVSQPTDVRIGDDLEDQRRKRLVGRGAALFGLAGVRVVALNGGNVEWGRQVVDNPIQHALDAPVAQGAATEYRRSLVGDGGPSQGGAQFFDFDLIPF